MTGSVAASVAHRRLCAHRCSYRVEQDVRPDRWDGLTVGYSAPCPLSLVTAGAGSSKAAAMTTATIVRDRMLIPPAPSCVIPRRVARETLPLSLR